MYTSTMKIRKFGELKLIDCEVNINESFGKTKLVLRLWEVYQSKEYHNREFYSKCLLHK